MCVHLLQGDVCGCGWCVWVMCGWCVGDVWVVCVGDVCVHNVVGSGGVWCVWVGGMWVMCVDGVSDCVLCMCDCVYMLVWGPCKKCYLQGPQPMCAVRVYAYKCYVRVNVCIQRCTW